MQESHGPPIILPLDARAALSKELVASMGGAPQNPVWYHNLKADPTAVTIQDGPEPWDADIEELPEGPERDAWWARAVAAFPPYADYQEKTDRLIPVFLARRRA